MSESVQEYEVTQENCLNHEVGDIIELTAKKAKHLVNKVVLVKPKKATKKASNK